MIKLFANEEATLAETVGAQLGIIDFIKLADAIRDMKMAGQFQTQQHWENGQMQPSNCLL